MGQGGAGFEVECRVGQGGAGCEVECRVEEDEVVIGGLKRPTLSIRDP